MQRIEFEHNHQDGNSRNALTGPLVRVQLIDIKV